MFLANFNHLSYFEIAGLHNTTERQLLFKGQLQQHIPLQALTTGSIPGFIDVVMNLNSPALSEDNLIWQAKTAGKKIIFYGDDTWVRLFPKHFMEYDGTTSFFVSDYTEVCGEFNCCSLAAHTSRKDTNTR